MVSRRVVRSYQARYSLGANKASMYDLSDAIDVTPTRAATTKRSPCTPRRRRAGPA